MGMQLFGKNYTGTDIFSHYYNVDTKTILSKTINLPKHFYTYHFQIMWTDSWTKSYPGGISPISCTHS